ncbi:hypothetical protein N657DRAFT_301754 [Parathielavia appendiculata]|uniref:Uncharacterized protein n=1 Tax=Parathielavia appendiculata TaxID=2587402 RepID=A0AAN6U4I9_9PEZI|nr:hypothetical protein N657DRAFT_301754 [Parathielavia appendiculata]
MEQGETSSRAGLTQPTGAFLAVTIASVPEDGYYLQPPIPNKLFCTAATACIRSLSAIMSCRAFIRSNGLTLSTTSLSSSCSGQPHAVCAIISCRKTSSMRDEPCYRRPSPPRRTAISVRFWSFSDTNLLRPHQAFPSGRVCGTWTDHPSFSATSPDMTGLGAPVFSVTITAKNGPSDMRPLVEGRGKRNGCIAMTGGVGWTPTTAVIFRLTTWFCAHAPTLSSSRRL